MRRLIVNIFGVEKEGLFEETYSARNNTFVYPFPLSLLPFSLLLWIAMAIVLL